jgi:hypothetical protein
MSLKLAEVVETLVEALNKRKRQRLTKLAVRSLRGGTPPWQKKSMRNLPTQSLQIRATLNRSFGQGPPFWY